MALLLTGCIDTNYQPVDEEPVDEPDVEDVTEDNFCDDFPDHAECLPPLTSFQEYTYTNGMEFFNASIKLSLFLGDGQYGIDYVSKYKRLGEKYHQLTDKYNLYDGVVNIKTINDDPSSKHYLEKELYDLLKYSISKYELSEGYFDITIGPASSIWHDYRDKCLQYYNDVPAFCNLPSVDELEEVEDKIDISKIVLDDDEMSIQMEEGMSLDLGGVAKGYFVEIIAQVFAENGLRAFLINAGGNIKVYGDKPMDITYSIGVQDPTKPRGEAGLPFTINLPKGYSAVSSGDQINSYEVDGEIYHHIINPYTLWPDRYSRQVTVITKDSRLADIISTSVYLMSVEDGMEYISNLEDVEAIWYGLDDKIYYSDNVNELLTFDE